jgi:hypothetical protein
MMSAFLRCLSFWSISGNSFLVRRARAISAGQAGHRDFT